MRFKLYFDSRKCTDIFQKPGRKRKFHYADFTLSSQPQHNCPRTNLCGSDGLSSQTGLLADVETGNLLLLGLLSLLDNLILLGNNDLDVGWVGHVWVDTSVGTVCASSLLWCLVDLDVGDNKVGGVETLDVGVGNSVLEETEKELGGLLWPATLGGTELLSLGSSSGGSGEAAEWDTLLVGLHVLEEGDGTGDLETLDGLGGFPGVLVGNTKVRTAGLSGLLSVEGGSGVADHL